jgi:hypothetical protein
LGKLAVFVQALNKSFIEVNSYGKEMQPTITLLHPGPCKAVWRQWEKGKALFTLDEKCGNTLFGRKHNRTKLRG